MPIKYWFCLFLVGWQATAKEHWSLERFLKAVQERNPEVAAIASNTKSLEERLDEAEIQLSPIAFSDYKYLSDGKQTSNPLFMGEKTTATDFRLGVKKDFATGLSSSVYLETVRTNIHGVNSSFIPMNDYTESRAVVELRQSLWRNGFGDQTKAQIESSNKKIKAEMLRSRYQLKTQLLGAENVYWTLASLDRILKLQVENVERAHKLAVLMANRAGSNLVDDVDALQATAALQARELELKQSEDDRAAALRQFYTLMGSEQQQEREVELEMFPEKEWTDQMRGLSKTSRKREDFEAMRSQGSAHIAESKSNQSNINPDLNLVASYASNGRDGLVSKSYQDAGKLDHPTWNLGIVFQIPLDFHLIHKLRAAYRAQKEAGEEILGQADFQEKRLWDDLIFKRKDAQSQYELASEIEKVRAKIVTRDHLRLINGRSTTFQAVTFEQELAAAQIQKVRAELVLIQIHNQIQLFAEVL
jgi:outer membrane protein TolC